MKQKGFAHVQLIAGLVLVLGVVSFAAYRVGQSNSTTNNNTENDQTVELAEGIEVKEEESKEITVPNEEPEKSPEPVEAKPVETKPAEQAPEKKDKIYLSMKSVSATQDGSIVYVNSQVEQAVSGTCNFKLYREGFEKVQSTSKISNSQDCVGQINVASLPNYEGWSLFVWFDGDDGKTFAYQEDIDNFPLTNPN